MDKYVIEGSTLTDIGDAIRTRLEITDKMPASEMAGLIESIPKGVQMVSGTFTPSSRVSTYTITHNLGVVPTHIAVFSLAQKANSSFIIRDFLVVNGACIAAVALKYNTSDTYAYSFLANQTTITASETQFTLTARAPGTSSSTSSSGETTYYEANVVYYYYIWREE